MSNPTDATVREAATARYERLLRAYPKTWRDANGRAVLGTMLDAADAENRRRPSLSETINTVQHGLTVRLTTALPDDVRDHVAGVAVGTGLGITTALFAGYSWTRSDFYTGTAVAGPIWFLPAWLLIVLAAWSSRLPLRIGAFALATAALVAVPTLKPGPYFTAPFPRHVTIGDPAPTGVVFATPGQIIPTSAATVTLLILLAAHTLLGRPTPTDIRVSAVCSLAVAGLIIGLAVWATPWPDYFSDTRIWTWPGFRVPGLPLGFSAPTLILIGLLLTASIGLRRRAVFTAATCAFGALLVIGADLALTLAGPTPIGL